MLLVFYNIKTLFEIQMINIAPRRYLSMCDLHFTDRAGDWNEDGDGALQALAV